VGVRIEGDSRCDEGIGVFGAKRKWLREMREAESAGDGKKGRCVLMERTYSYSNRSDDRGERLPVCNKSAGHLPSQEK
jgi:hypothetical protein